MFLENQDQIDLWQCRIFPGNYLSRAHFKDFVFDKHTHDEFAIGVVEKGADQFSHKGSLHRAPAQSIISINPDEVHDGCSATASGVKYRMTYISPETVQEIMGEYYPHASTLTFFNAPVTKDPALARRLLHALYLIDQKNPKNLLEIQTYYAQAIADLFIRHTTPRPLSDLPQKNHSLIQKACEYIRANAHCNLTLDQIAKAVGLSRFHFLRLFKATTGMPPHAYLIRRRVELAKQAIVLGTPLAEAAIDAGFADQSHLSRKFKATYGLSPGQFQKALGR